MKLFLKCFQMISDTVLTFKEFWKEHYNSLSRVGLIEKSWANVSLRTLRSDWKCGLKLYRRDSEGCVEEPGACIDPKVDEIVTIAESLSLQADRW